MSDAKDIRIFAGGKWTSALGQKAHDGAAWRTPKGGTHIRRGNTWDIYREDLNASVRVFPAEGGAIVRAVVKTLPSGLFRPKGTYHLNHAVMKASVRIDLIADFTDATSDPLVIETDNFLCNASEQTFSVAVPLGKTCYRVTVGDVRITPEGMGAHAYRQKEVTVTVEPLHFTAEAFVYPAGAGTATATPSNPTYGQIVTFTATDAPGYTFTEWLESGKKERSYAVKAYGNIRDTAGFSDTSNVVGFFIRVYMDSSRHICVEARTLQNRSDQFAMVSFTLTYTDTSGMTQTLDYEREVYLNGTPDNHTFTETASSLNSNTKPSVGILPNPLKLGTVEVVLDNGDMLMTQSLRAGYSLWEITADDDDAGPGDPG